MNWEASPGTPSACSALGGGEMLNKELSWGGCDGAGGVLCGCLN